MTNDASVEAVLKKHLRISIDQDWDGMKYAILGIDEAAAELAALSPAPTSGSEAGGGDTIAALRRDLWEAKYALAQSRENAQAWHRVCQAIATVLGLPEPEADFANVVRDWSERALAKPASSPADVREALAKLDALSLPIVATLFVARGGATARAVRGVEAGADERSNLVRLSDVTAALEPIRAALSPSTSAAEPVAWIANCCHCGRIVDTREEKEGGDKFGCELTDGRWTCSPECWDAVVEPDATPPAPAAVDGQRVKAPLDAEDEMDPAGRIRACLATDKEGA